MSEYSDLNRLVAELLSGGNLEIRDENYLISPAFGIQLEALVADAERYRWIKECNGGPIGIVAWHQDEEKEMILVEQYADEAIDAARNSSPENS